MKLSIAIKNYLTFLKNEARYKIKEIIIDDCNMDDSILKNILEASAS